MAFGGLDLQALRNELGEAQRERMALMEHASELEQEMGLGQGALLTRAGDTGAPTGQANSGPRPPPQASGPKRLSWGASSRPAASQQPRIVSQDATANATTGGTYEVPSDTCAAFSSLTQPQPSDVSISRTTDLNNPNCTASTSTAPSPSSNATTTTAAAAAAALVSSSLPPTPMYGGAAKVGGGTSGASATAALEDGIRRRVLREVLAAMLGEAASPMIEHMQLNIQTVVAVSKERAQQCVEETRRAASEKAKIEKTNKAALEDAAGAEAEKGRAAAFRQLEDAVDKLQREVDTLQREKKSLSSRATQQNKQTKEATEMLKVLKDQVESYERQVEQQSKSISKAQSDVRAAKVEGERRVKEAEAAAAVRVQELSDQHQRDLQLIAQQHAEMVSAASQAQHSNAAVRTTLQQTVSAAFSEVVSEVEALMGVMADVQGSVAQQLDAMGAELAALRMDASAATSKMRGEVSSARADFESVVGGFRAACSVATRHCNDRVSQLTRLDSQLAVLGPGGLDSVLLQVATTTQQVSQLEALRDALQMELRSSEEARRKLMMEYQRQTSELSLMSSNATETVRDVAAAHGRAVVAEAKAVTLCKKVAELQANCKLAEVEGKRLALELVAAREQLAESMAHSKELEVTVSTLHSAVDDAARFGREAADEAAREALLETASMVHRLRCKYFQASSNTPTVQVQSASKESSSTTTSPVSGGRPPLGVAKPSAAEGADRRTPSAPQVIPGPTSKGHSTCGCVGEWGLVPMVGLRMCDLSHDEIAHSLEAYVKRQAKVMSSASIAERLYLDIAIRSSSSCVDMREVVSGELLWLEGCLLLLLVDLRQKAKEVERLAAEGEEGAAGKQGKAQVDEKQVCARGFASQMMRALASEKRSLQKQLTKLESKETEKAASIFSYLPQRRSNSARISNYGMGTLDLSATGPLTAAPPSLPMGLASSMGVDRVRRSSEPANLSLGGSAQTGGPRPRESDGDSHHAVEAWVDETTHRGTVVLPPPPSEGGPSAPGCTGCTALPANNRQSYDMDEVLSILDSLDDSTVLRRNRSMPTQQQYQGGASSRSPSSLPPTGSRGYGSWRPVASRESSYSGVGSTTPVRSPYNAKSRH